MTFRNVLNFANYLVTMESSDQRVGQMTPELAGYVPSRGAELLKTAFWMGMSIALSCALSQLR